MNWEQVREELNIAAQAKKYGIPLWQHPQFLFLVMGLLIVASSLLSYILGRRYIAEPEVAALFVILLAVVLLVLSFFITRSFERLAEASRLKSEFVSVVSHQLRAPLTNMKWTLDLLVSGKGKKAEGKYFSVLEENSNRMQELVNDLLVASRIEQGGLATKRHAFFVQEVLDEVVKSFKPMLQAAGISVNKEADSSLRRVFADPSQIRQVLSNLLDNAIKYTSRAARGHAIALRLKDKGSGLYVEVEDSGVGIPAEDQKYIFQKFFRSSNAMRHETQGSGLGLYIAHSIIKRSRGEMGFSSEQGKGSTFWFTLPYA